MLQCTEVNKSVSESKYFPKQLIAKLFVASQSQGQ